MGGRKKETEPAKRCSRCNKVKPLSQYHKYKYGKDGRFAQCGPCRQGESKRRRSNPVVLQLGDEKQVRPKYLKVVFFRRGDDIYLDYIKIKIKGCDPVKWRPQCVRVAEGMYVKMIEMAAEEK